MPRTCTICRHSEAQAINEALLAQEPYRHIASRFALSTRSLQRHKNDHLPVTLVKAELVREEIAAGSLLDRLREIHEETRGILREARISGAPGVALLAISRVEKQIELEGKLLGLLSATDNEALRMAIGNLPKPAPAKYDLKHLTDDELRELARLHDKMKLKSSVQSMRDRLGIDIPEDF